MLRSTFCILDGLDDKDLFELNECPYDKVISLSLYSPHEEGTELILTGSNRADTLLLMDQRKY